MMVTTKPVSSVTTVALPVEGVICGAVLRQCRRALYVYQEGMADQLLVDINTYRSWEHGRRSVTRLPLHRFKSLTRELLTAGVRPEYVDLLELGVEVDLAIGRAMSSAENPLPPAGQCNGWHELLAWALVGTIPAVFAASGDRVTQPRLSTPDRNHLLKRIRHAIDKPASDLDDSAIALLRRLYIDGLPLPPAKPKPDPNRVCELATQLMDVASALLESHGGTQ